MTPELCASCVSRTAIVVCSSGQTTTSESCSHPENPSVVIEGQAEVGEARRSASPRM